MSHASLPALAWRVLALLLTGSTLDAQTLIPAPAADARIASGFELRVFADSTLADDIQAMTIDSVGRVVVTGPGYIRTLFDDNSDGFADRSVPFAKTETGGMGLCFSGTTLLFSGDGGLWRYLDENLDGIADAAPLKLMTLKGGEHGIHGIRQGPDGSWFVVAGNDAGAVAGTATDPRSSVRIPQAGSILRMNNQNAQVGIFSHGLRNPYDLDFNSYGDLFTYDSDVERELHLPWYTPTRVYHTGPGAHHGWRLNGYQRSFKRPDHYPGVVPDNGRLGRGSPTGVVCYRHLQFPPRYQNGLFLLDWTFGKVWFTPLIPSDATYQTEPSIFLEATGRSGFAPTDAAVAPDGSLLISCGGRKTRGVIYRIRYIMDPARLDMARNWKDDAANEVVLALQAPQPTDAWSRAIWGPAAVKLTSRPFDLAAISEELPDSMRIRAVEILTEAHGGLMTVTAEAGSQMASPFLRARIAWSLGRIPCAGFSPIVARLAQDGSAMVRRCALEAAFEQMEGMKIEDLLQCSMVNAGHPDRRIRQLAASIAVSLPLEHWKTFFTTLATASPSAQLGAAWAAAMRFPTNGFNSALAGLALRPFRQATQPADRLEALGLMMMALGDWDLENPGVELYTSYSAAHLPAPADPVRGSMAQAALTALGTGDSMLAWEGARLLAMLQSRDTNAPARLLSQITPGTPAPSDFHYLIALSRLPSTISPDTTRRTAQALIGLSRKLNGLQNRPKQTWNDRASELYAQLFRRDAALATQLASHADFNRLDQAPIALAMDSTNRMICARRFLAQAIGDASLRWTPDLVRLFESLPARETQAALRAQWKQVELRDELLLALARDPQAIDRDKFVLGLDSLHSAACIASLHSLLVVPPDPKNLAPSVAAVSRLLRRSVQNPSLAIRPPQVVSLLNRLTGQSFRLPEETSDALALEQSTRPVFEWLGKNHPQHGSNLRATGDRDAQWETLLRSVDWNRGNATAGESIYNTRGCALCHGGAANLGPDLTGSTKRWSPADLFQQIRYPNLLVPEAYRVHRIRTRDGRTFLGIPAYFSAETLLLKLADGQTLRLDQADIVSQEPGTDSPMPDNLMDGMTAQSLADLYAFMKQLDAAVE